MTENLKPGRELDELVAQKVMELSVSPERQREYERLLAKHEEDMKVYRAAWDVYGSELAGPPTPPKKPRITFPPYSTDMSAAWQIVEKLGPKFWFGLGDDTDDDKWNANFYNKSQHFSAFHCDTAQYAICMAALQAVGMRVDE